MEYSGIFQGVASHVCILDVTNLTTLPVIVAYSFYVAKSYDKTVKIATFAGYGEDISGCEAKVKFDSFAIFGENYHQLSQ